jgi:flagellar biosynthetic protein FlhB
MEYFITNISFDLFAEKPRRKLNLQRFASPEAEGRTEEPTEKKIRDARKKGQVAKTEEFPAAFVVIVGVSYVLLMGRWMYGNIMHMSMYYLSQFKSFTISYNSLSVESLRVLVELGKLLLPVFAATYVAGFVGNIIQVGFKFSAHPLKFDLSKIKFTPADMMKKLFISKKVAMNLFKSIFKISVIAFSSYLIISADFHILLRTPDVSLASAFADVSFIAFKIIIVSAVLLIVLAVPDYFFQRKEFIDSLKMTKQEIKEEQKESQGDPQIKARLREMQREILTRNMIREVPKADVIVTNPTHFAIALQWEQATMQAPTVIAKGVDSMALRIRESAKTHDIMIIENRPLAQALYRDVEIGNEIPVEFFQAVTEIYSVLYQKGRLKAAI